MNGTDHLLKLGKVMNYQNHIIIEPGKRGGEPCIRGMRITVYEVSESYFVCSTETV